MADLLGNQATSGLAGQVGSWATSTVGTRFRVTKEVTCTHMGFYRPVGTQLEYVGLTLWGDAGATLENVPSPNDSGGVGWQWTALTTPQVLVPGITYTVSTNTSRAGINTRPGTACVNRAAPPSPFMLDDFCGHTGAGAGIYPTAPQSDWLDALSVRVVVPPPPPEGQGDPTLTGDVHAWLSADPIVQQHEEDGLPWLTREQVSALAAAVGLIPKALDTDWTRVTEIWQFAGDLTDVQLGLWRAFMDRAGAQLTGPTAGGGSAFHGPGGIQVSAAAEEILLAVDKLWHRTQTTNWLTPIPSAEWIKQDELPWSGPIGWNQEADVYVCHITDFPPSWDQQDVDGKLWLPRAAWWAPLTGTLPHERHFVDFEFQILHALPMRASGLLFCPREGFAGTLEAWTRPDV